MPYWVNTNLTLTPDAAIRQIELVVLDVAREFNVRVYLTSGWRKPRYVGDKSYHRYDLARDYDFWTLDGSSRIDHAVWQLIVFELQSRLPSKFFDVVDEWDKDHVHLEVDFK